MKVGRTSIFNFMSEEDCDKYIAMHTQKNARVARLGNIGIELCTSKLRVSVSLHGIRVG